MQRVISEGAQIALKKGIDLAVNAIKVTAGPRGKNVMMHRGFGMSEVTNDGVTVARSLDQQHDPVVNMGVTLVQEVCSDTEAMSGDGTTAAAILLQEMITRGMKAVAVGSNVMSLKRGMEKATGSIVKALESMALNIEKDTTFIRKVATISANNDEVLGAIIGGAFEKVGPTGIIAIEDSVGPETKLVMAEGLKFQRGYTSGYFMTDERTKTAIIDNPYILVTDSRLASSKSLSKIYDKIPAGETLVVVSDAVGAQPLQTIVMAHLQQKVNMCLIKTPGFGDNKTDLTKDLCAAVGATFISVDKGDKMDSIKLSDLGRATKIIVGEEETTVIGGKGDKQLLADRIVNVKSQMEDKDNDDYQTGNLNERLAILSGGVAMIKIGAISETELKEKKRRIDDALAATRAAISEGIVPGGGIALNIALASIGEISYDDEDELAGIKVVTGSLRSPFDTILRNGGYEPGEVLAKMNELGAGFGLNVKTGKYVNMLEDGVIDPVKVIKASLMNSSSIASMMLTTDVLICESEQEEN